MIAKLVIVETYSVDIVAKGNILRVGSRRFETQMGGPYGQ
jgi:hypothetical protein